MGSMVLMLHEVNMLDMTDRTGVVGYDGEDIMGSMVLNNVYFA